MNLKQNDLLSGEVVVMSKSANAIIRIASYGTIGFALDQLIPTTGIDGIGGKLYWSAPQYLAQL
jgi:hypothetical protein